MVQPVDLSIITISHNHRHLLDVCLRSLLETQRNVSLEVIVVDNTGADGTTQMVEARYPEVRLVRNGRPVGYAANANKGLRLAQGRYPLLLNPDMELLPGALDALVDFMDAEPGVGLAGPKLLNPDGSLQPSCRRFTTPAHFFIRGLRLDGLLANTPTIREAVYAGWDHADVRDVEYVTGACMIVRREALANVGLMDEGYELYFEDQDWCYRMGEQGWRVAYVPQSQMIHHHQRASARGLFNHSTRVHVQSMVRYLRKHHLPTPFQLRVREPVLDGARMNEEPR
jgi:N-acetylglucosaminyl-diphospho-decaprenol L-rhamnosyltransferase